MILSKRSVRKYGKLVLIGAPPPFNKLPWTHLLEMKKRGKKFDNDGKGKGMRIDNR